MCVCMSITGLFILAVLLCFDITQRWKYRSEKATYGEKFLRKSYTVLQGQATICSGPPQKHPTYWSVDSGYYEQLKPQCLRNTSKEILARIGKPRRISKWRAHSDLARDRASGLEATIRQKVKFTNSDNYQHASKRPLLGCKDRDREITCDAT